MIKINGKKGDINVTGGTNEVIAELSLVIGYFSEAFAAAKNIPLDVAECYIMNQINANLQKKRLLKEDEQGAEQE